MDSSSNQDLDSGIISTKPGAGLLWDKPYLSSLKESFEASLSADSSSVSGGDAIDIDIDLDSNPRPPIDINIPSGGPVGIVAPGDITPSKPTSGSDTDEALTAPNASGSQGDFYLLALLGIEIYNLLLFFYFSFKFELAWIIFDAFETL